MMEYSLTCDVDAGVVGVGSGELWRDTCFNPSEFSNSTKGTIGALLRVMSVFLWENRVFFSFTKTSIRFINPTAPPHLFRIILPKTFKDNR